jgi:hypothetical protein
LLTTVTLDRLTEKTKLDGAQIRRAGIGAVLTVTAEPGTLLEITVVNIEEAGDGECEKDCSVDVLLMAATWQCLVLFEQWLHGDDRTISRPPR